MQSAIKPSKQFKNDLLTTPSSDSDQDHRSSISSDSDFDLIDIPSNNLEDLPQEEALAQILFYWDAMTANINKFAGMLQRLHNQAMMNIDALDFKVDSVESKLGVCSKPDLLENFITSWDGIVIINKGIGGLTTFVQAGEGRLQTLEDSWLTRLWDHDSKFDALAAEVGKGFNNMLELIMC